ncbi:MAG: CCA tRNA nucleotidyltransferase [Acetobacter sp.]|nr:CCA tRNA nucleotidyltransferase [Acetobacter sp.]
MLFEQLEPLSQEALKHLWSVLPQARLVGGVVRDLLAQRPITDIDIATPQPPEEVIRLLQAAGIHVVPTGLQHGTVTAVIEGVPYEITTLRRDEETDGRHARVCWTENWKEDALRRDFTINTLSMDCNGVIYDYVGGQADLQAGVVRFVGDAETRIREDALRILRYFRFYARFNQCEHDLYHDLYHDSAVDAICHLSSLLCGLSVERIWSEFKRILCGPKVGETLRLMQQTGVLAYVLPEGFCLNRLENLLALHTHMPSQIFSQPPYQPLLRLAAITEQPKHIVQRLKLSREESRFVCAVSKEFSQKEKEALTYSVLHIRENALRALFSQESKEILEGRLWLAQCDDDYAVTQQDREAKKRGDEIKNDFCHAITQLVTMEKPQFPVAGRDVIAVGKISGPDVGLLLERVRQWWCAGGCWADRTACLQKLEAFVQQDKHEKPI